MILVSETLGGLKEVSISEELSLIISGNQKIDLLERLLDVILTFV